MGKTGKTRNSSPRPKKAKKSKSKEAQSLRLKENKELYLEVSDHRRSLAHLEGSNRLARFLALAFLFFGLAALIVLSRSNF